MATLVRGATRWLSSALHLGGAPGRKFSKALGEERAAVFHLLEAYNDHVEAVSPYTAAAVRLMPAVQKTVPQIGYSIETLLMQEALSGISSLNISSKPSAWEVEQQESAERYIKELEYDFTLVLLLEHLDESLVLLRRLMCWEMQDILYDKTPSNNADYAYKSYTPTAQELANLRRWKAVDYLLYDTFNKSLWRKIAIQGPDFYQELRYFKKLREDVNFYCHGNHTLPNLTLAVEASKWSQPFVVDAEYCWALKKDEALSGISSLNISSKPSAWELEQQAPICGICLRDSPSLSHVMEECGHVFCEDCLSTHCHYVMEQGTWIIKCAGSGCDVNISADVLWAVLDTKTFRRQQKKAEEQETERKVLAEEREVDWCPKCRGISRVSSEVYSSGRRRADCEKCGHAFCTRCRDWWHGRLGQCSHRVWKNKRTSSRITISGELGSDGTEGWEERVKGRKKHDALSNKLIMDTTTPCPKCHAPIYRTTGCNSMFCVRCKHGFCYGCGAPSTTCSCYRRQTNQGPPIVNAVRGILKVDPTAFDHAECAACPACHRMNRKRNTDNHIRCVVCKTSYCFTCKQRLTGNVGSHYK
uniref:RBR-type E3 ubiquitin transferase n=1 Tax=Branchiostoma floridae TaxID=7739 RepID=C3Y8E6_BRAFL|eukprot:XP_002607373.1 hypothetical protein BRAFLDRAFT_69779 [Branchiostoma floridae]